MVPWFVQIDGSDLEVITSEKCEQAQFIEQPLPRRPTDVRMAELLDWLRANPGMPHPIDAVAERMALSRRTFTRRFRQLTGTTLGDWLLRERVALAQSRLETTTHSVEEIAAENFADSLSTDVQGATTRPSVAGTGPGSGGTG